MMVKKIPLTQTGYLRLQDELKKLKAERPIIRHDLEEARKLGDFSENAELDAARDRQGFVEGRIRELEDKISRAEIIDPTSFTGKLVRFGATVTLFDEDNENTLSYQIVGEEESDIKNGQLSVAAPLACALIGKSEGDSFDINTPRGVKSYTIQTVAYS